LVEANLEGRWHLFRNAGNLFGFIHLPNISLVGFYDIGNVWASPKKLRVDDLAMAAGIGFRWDTIAGPIRIDFAMRVYDPTAPERQWITQRRLFHETYSLVQFGIGHAFLGGRNQEMSWDSVIGQGRAKELLRRAVGRKQLAHAYLFSGIDGIGKDAFALELAKVLNCEQAGDQACGECSSCKKAGHLQHPNIRFVCALPVGKNEKLGDDPILTLPEDLLTEVQQQLRTKAADPYHRVGIPRANFIKVNSIRDVRREASLARHSEGRRVFIISRAEMMNAEAGNSLLKTLEEPPGSSVLILTTSMKERLLATIVSRCQHVQFDPLREEEIRDALMTRDGVPEEGAGLAAELAEGSYVRARELLSEDIQQVRQDVVAFLRMVLSGKTSSVLQEIERLNATDDKGVRDRWLRMLQVWLRDARLVKDRHPVRHVHEDAQADLERFVANFPKADLWLAHEVVDRSIALLNKNVYFPLIAASLAHQLKSILSTGRPLHQPS
ncbi:MAG: DNA polymerase III subunit delta', partial [Bacteroidota bacterium]